MLAAVDLGSNSFRLVIARVERDAGGRHIEAVAGLKRTVRLAAGLRDDGMLDSASQDRGIEALTRFREHLHAFSPQAVRAVATNTLRVARNARHFLSLAEMALGFPIEVISGYEEARLIYTGAAYSLPEDGRPRLVVDIGGGSTECIVGIDRRAHVLESAPVGCVGLSQRFFPAGSVDRASFEQARTLARSVFEPMAGAFARRRWDYALGTSGTAKALLKIARLEFGAAVLDRHALHAIRRALLEAGHAERLQLAGLQPERRPVLAGGLAVMIAAFDEFAIESLDYCDGALRHGVLHGLFDRNAEADSHAGAGARAGADPRAGAGAIPHTATDARTTTEARTTTDSRTAAGARAATDTRGEPIERVIERHEI